MTQPDSQLVAVVGAEVRAAALTATVPTIVEVFNTATSTPQVFTQPYPAVSLGGAPHHRVVLDSIADLERTRPSPLPPLAVAVILPQQGIAYVQLANDPAAKVVKLDRGADDDPHIRREVGTGLATLLAALTDAHAQHRATTRAHPFAPLSTPDRSETAVWRNDPLVTALRHSAATASQPTLVLMGNDPADPHLRHLDYDPGTPDAGPEHHARALDQLRERIASLGRVGRPLAAAVILPDRHIAYLRRVDRATTTTIALARDWVDDATTRQAIGADLGVALESMTTTHTAAIAEAHNLLSKLLPGYVPPAPPPPSSPPTRPTRRGR